MKFTKLYTGEDNKSHFMEVDAGVETKQPLGNYSPNYPTTGMMFRDFEEKIMRGGILSLIIILFVFSAFLARPFSEFVQMVFRILVG